MQAHDPISRALLRKMTENLDVIPDKRFDDRGRPIPTQPPPAMAVRSKQFIPNGAIVAPRDPYASLLHMYFGQPQKIGSGTFGKVYLVRLCVSNEKVAIKKVKKEGSKFLRELEIMRMLDHQNVTMLRYYFITRDENDDIHYYFVMDYVERTLTDIIVDWREEKRKPTPVFLVRVYTIQLARALHYLHKNRIAHRDVKSQNVLVCPRTHIVRLCDFGSAKILKEGETNVPFICSRYYRAPELLLGYSKYTTAIDMWSFGIIMVEALTGTTPFNGANELGQIDAISKVLGYPPKDILAEIWKTMDEFPEVPKNKAKNLKNVLPKFVCKEAVSLLKKLLVYDWTKRPSAIEVCADEFFDDIRAENAHLHMFVPYVFNWTDDEMQPRLDLKHKIIPKYVIKNKGFDFRGS